ncbi:MAG: GerMN domain-containing protein [Bacillota bacterium]
MKRVQPYYYIVSLAVLFIMAGIVFFAIQLMPKTEQTGVTIDPQVPEEGGTLYDLWFTSANIYDLGVDHALTGILVSTDENKVSLLDQQRKLRWDLSFSTAPEQAKISSCGNYVATGTRGGRILFMSTDQAYSWEDEGLPVNLLDISPNANWLAVSRSQPDDEQYYVELYNREGDLQWIKESGPVENLFMSSEYFQQANVFYSYLDGDQPVISALNPDGEELWSYEGQTLAAVSRHGSRLAAVESDRLVVYNTLGEILWETEMPFEPTTVMFNPQNHNRLLAYGSEKGAGENLYYFDLEEDLLWSRKVADGSLFSFTADGQYIVTGSWKHYREDYTQMKILDRHGSEVNSWEVSMRVEKLLKSGHPHLIVIGGEDGYIDLINLEPMFAESNEEVPVTNVYNSVKTGREENNMITLYFVDENDNLIPVSRSINSVDNPLRTAVEELIRGPSRGSALYRAIPEKDATIEVDFDESEGSLVLDLSPDLVDISGAGQSRVALDSLLYTVSTFSEVREIYLKKEGETLEEFGEDIELEQPFAPKQWENPVFKPVMSGNRYYLMIDEAEAENEEEMDIKGLVDRAISACRMLPFVPNNLELIEIKINQEETMINLDDSFKEIFPEEGEKQERLQAELILDALIMTIFENSRTQRVKVLVEGESWSSPEGYPSLERFHYNRYHINPEV